MTYNGYVNAYRRDTYSGLDPGAPISESYWFWNDSGGSMYMIGVSGAGGPIPPMLVMPSRFVLDNVYTTYDMGGGDTRKIKVDVVQSTTVPLGTYLFLRMNFQDNVAGTVTTNYQLGAPGVHIKLKWTDPGCSDSLAWFQSNGATFGNKPTTVPFTLQFTNFAAIYLREETSGTRRYYYDVEVKRPGGSMVPDNTTVQNVQFYAYPSMMGIPLSGSWNTRRGTYFYYDSDGTGANPPYPYPYSGVQGYLGVAADALSPGFYKVVVTDNTGQRQSNWIYHEPPTETGKVQFASMGQVNNGDNSVTLSWTLPASPPLVAAVV